MKSNTRHGHYSEAFEREANRIKEMYKDMLNITITWMEATTIAAMRSTTTFWNEKKLKEEISKLRGL
jgi:hypothetical protein